MAVQAQALAVIILLPQVAPLLVLVHKVLQAANAFLCVSN